MFEATIEIVLENPVTVIALLPALYFTATTLWGVRKPLVSILMATTAIGLSPIFLLFVVGEFTGSSVWMSLGNSVFQIEASVVAGVVRVYDGLIAAWLRLFALVFDSLLSIRLLPADMSVRGVPVNEVLPVWVSVFVLHVAGGVMLVYGLYRGNESSSMDTLLRGGGVAFLIAGLFVVVLQSRVVAFDASAIGVLLMAVVGLEIGVAVVLLGVRPDFSGGDNDEFDDASSAMKDVRDSLLSRLTMYMNRLQSDVNEE
ncbi:hypothetical protein [Halocatena marina]|uniref:hypothetical protein n=1 Tax=Halocatena marina TaxID=2934937 RepID=UPI00200FF983|nr:hypothetical protein [Halocatena marina]